MRSDRTATCTSGDPVSPDLVAKLLMTSALRAGVIDIGSPFFRRVLGYAAWPGCRPARSLQCAGPKPTRRRDIGCGGLGQGTQPSEPQEQGRRIGRIASIWPRHRGRMVNADLSYRPSVIRVPLVVRL